jgi:hypothetical protein
MKVPVAEKYACACAHVPGAPASAAATRQRDNSNLALRDITIPSRLMSQRYDCNDSGQSLALARAGCQRTASVPTVTLRFNLIPDIAFFLDILASRDR